MKKLKQVLERTLCNLQRKKPLVHCITNTVTINDCANILLALGASPTMAHHPLEVAEVTSGCDSFVVNLGATDDYKAILIAAKTAGNLGHPIIVDPVGVSGSSFRRDFFWELAKTAPLSCVRGNASEIWALAQNCNTISGVDASSELSQEDLSIIHQHGESLSKKLGCIVVTSGKTDDITDGSIHYSITQGDPMMRRVTGTGCMSTAVLGAMLAIDPSIDSVAAGCLLMGLSAEHAIHVAHTPMAYREALIDEIYKEGCRFCE